MNTAPAQATQSVHAFTQEARDAAYHTIFSRRDARGSFLSTPVADEVLSRILTAAHYAPPVGFIKHVGLRGDQRPLIARVQRDQAIAQRASQTAWA